MPSTTERLKDRKLTSGIHKVELLSDLDKKWVGPLGRLDSPKTEKKTIGGSGHIGLFEGFDYRRQ